MKSTHLTAFVIVVLLAALISHARGDVDNLQFLGHNEVNRAHLMDVELVGNRAYVCNALGSNRGLEVYDISNPSSPTRTFQTGPSTWRCVSSGDTLLFAFCRRSGVVLYDISGTGNPVRLGQYDPPGNREALEGGALVGNVLYCAAHQNGVYAIDISNPNSPQKTGALSLSPTGAAWNVEAKDSFLFVPNGRHGLAVIGLEGGMRRIADVALPGLANDIVLDGDIAVISLGAGGLATVDVSDPYDPVLRDTIGTDGCAWGSGLIGHLVIVGSWRVMELFDISDPDNITRTGWDNTYVWAHGADVRDDSVIAVADWRGMSVYRIGADPGSDIDVLPEVLDFGTLADSRDTTVTIRNTGSAQLEVTSVSTPSGISVLPTSFTVPPGDSQLVTVTAAGSGQLNSQITWNCNDPDEPGWRQEVYKNNAGRFPEYGSTVPDFNLQGTDANWHRLSDYRGKVVYIQFGASW